MKTKKLSSNLTFPGVFLSAVVTIAMMPVAYNRVAQNGSMSLMLFVGIFFLGMIALQIYLFRFVCSAKVENGALFMKKLFRPAKEYTFDKIGEPKSIRIKNTVYTSVKMENEGTTHEKFLIVNSKSILSKNKIDTKNTLIELKNSILG
ncbi:hypothetical protein SAMN04489761_2702 [Tenacibaculum sp. MAR_2009_124]|uniref:hypothetical protein n=1 Tax=Tenacibaculum sp. MAR_2009_124 TaxID=1250059 RepID=UPI0008963C6F|nr:hypothetical protein [Tenacibaculum sp. MAR_2009_124]SEC33321.1 hypothetical protein SAMN04489761_2702 [Tenacibaculum sp. MAR_2009_124]